MKDQPRRYPAEVEDKMSITVPEGLYAAARKAAERWTANPSEELKQQIIATFRFTREIQSNSTSWSSSGKTADLRKAWEEAFKGFKDEKAFGFDFINDHVEGDS
jgi:hypothetical protein